MHALVTRLLELIEDLGLVPPSGADPALERTGEPAWALDEARAQERAAR